MRIIDQYIFKDTIKPFAAGVGAFIVIMLSNTLFLYAELIIKAGLPAKGVITLLLYNLPAIIVLTLPVGYMFSTLLVLGRLSKDSELTALRSCGVSFTRIIAPVLLMALLISYLGFVLNSRIVPETNHQSVLLQKDMMLNQKLPPVKEMVFTESGDKRAFYVSKVNKKKGVFEDVFVFDNSKSKTSDDYPQIISAKTAERIKNTWTLHDGTVKNYDKHGFVSYEAKFKAMEIGIEFSGIVDPTFNPSIQEMTPEEAWEAIEERKKRHENTKPLEVDYYLKYSLPMATFFVALICAPIGIKFAKMGTYFGVAISIALVFVWYVTYTLARSFGANGTMNTMLAAWVQNIAFAVFGVILLFFVNRK